MKEQSPQCKCFINLLILMTPFMGDSVKPNIIGVSFLIVQDDFHSSWFSVQGPETWSQQRWLDS